jgi:hypothetical protein
MKREVSNLVSEEVLKAAEAHASSKFKRGAEFHEWSIARDSFIKGADFNKPFEHEAKPEDNNGTGH